MGPVCVTQPNRTQPNPTQPNTTNNGAYSLVVTHFYTQSLCRTFCQRSILPHVLYCHYTYENSVIMSFKNKLFKEMLKMSSAANRRHIAAAVEQRDNRKDARTPDGCTVPAPHRAYTMRAAPTVLLWRYAPNSRAWSGYTLALDLRVHPVAPCPSVG